MKLCCLFEGRSSANWWTPKLVSKLWELRRQGLTYQQIADEIGLLANIEVKAGNIRSKIARLVKTGGVPSDVQLRGELAPNVSWTSELLDDLWKLKRRGIDNVAAAKALGISVGAIRDKIKKLKRRGEVPSDVKLGKRTEYVLWTLENTNKLWDGIRKELNTGEIARELETTMQKVRDKIRGSQRSNVVPADIDLSYWKHVIRAKRYGRKRVPARTDLYATRKGASGKSPRRSVRGGSSFDIGPHRTNWYQR